MKIICENCSAKYSIADEKVQGKVFKIRCKKCGESIVVRGDSSKADENASDPAYQAAASDAESSVEAPPPMPSEFEDEDEEDGESETRVFDYSGYHSVGEDQPIWHIVVDGQQQGPYTGGQIKQFLDTGSLDSESFIWKEGFEDWSSIKNVPELGWAGGTTPGAEGAAPQGAPVGGIFDSPAPSAGGGLFDQPAAGGLFGQGEDAAENVATPFDSGAGLFGGDGGSGVGPGDSAGDVFSSASPASTGGMFSADETMEPESAGVFGSKGQDLFGDAGDTSSGDGIFGSGGGQSPRVSAAQAMTGQRSENSVLFSLSNLQALAATPTSGDGDGGMFGGGPSAGVSAPAAVAGASGDEASGLIDIRSLAGSLSAEKEPTGVDDLISMGGGGFAPSLGAPVLAPQSHGLSLPIKISIAAGGVIILGLIVVLVVMVLQRDDGDSGQELAEVQLQELKKQLEEIRTSGGSAGQIESIQTKIAEQEKATRQTQVAATVGQRVTGKTPEPEATPDSAGAPEAKAPVAKRATSSASGKSRHSSGSKSTSSGSSSGSRAAAPSPSAGSAPKKRGGGADELDDLLSGSLSKPRKNASAKKAQPSPSAGSNTSKTLTRSDVQSGMNGVASRVKACGQGKTGTVTLKVVIGRTGRVMSANPTGPYAGTTVGSCAARAVRGAKFPVTDSNLTVRYPFKL